MKNIDYLLKQLSNGEIDTTRPMTDWYEKGNFICPDEEYEYEAELIKEQERFEILEKINEIYNDLLEEDSDRIEEYRIEKYESSDKGVYLEDVIEFIESKNTYIKSLKKRYENRIKDSSKNLKQIYMYEVYEYLKNILYSVKRHDDECKVEIIELIEKLENEIKETNLYNIDSEKIYDLISDLKDLQEFIECINFESKCNKLDLFDSANTKIIEIISTYFWDKQRQYRDNRLDKFKKRKERKYKYIKLYTSGYKKCEIAKIMGVTKSSVSKFLKQNNIK